MTRPITGLALSLCLAVTMCQHTKLAIHDYCEIMKDPGQRFRIVKERLKAYTPQERRVILNQVKTFEKICGA